MIARPTLTLYVSAIQHHDVKQLNFISKVRTVKSDRKMKKSQVRPECI